MNHPSLFQQLHHVCIVVRHLDTAVAYYESIGVGPWQDFPPLAAFKDELEVPDTAAFLALRYRYADLGNVQLQLCEPAEGDSPQRRFLDARGEGVFHLGFTVPDCDRGEEEGKAVGLQALMRGRRPDRSGFTYFDTADKGAGVTLEIRAAKPA